MITRKSPNKRKSRAQAMVEFALALPVLLTLLYGVLETGRLLFIYASTVTAARQAVRYGSATGDGPNGVPYYQDCAGIESAAHSVGFINVFDNIDIEYDDGPGTAVFDQCPPSNTISNNDRIKVTVSTQWVPIVPIVPLEPFTIESESARTILASVSIAVTAPASGGWGGTGSGTGVADLISVTADPTTYSAVGQVINFTYSLQNTGDGDLTPPPLIDSVASTSCPSDLIAPGATYTCTGTYVIDQSNLDDGIVESTAFPFGWPADTITTTITAIQTPSLHLAKSASPTATSRVGREIIYTYALTNTGNVTLVEPFSVFDDQITVDCSAVPAALAPGGTANCTGTDTVTESDINVGTITNTATASATFDAAVITSNTVTVVVLTPPIILEVYAPAIITAPGTATYTYKVINDTEYTATSVVINDDRATVSGSCPNTVPSEGEITCTGTYEFTQANIDAGDPLVNTIIVNAFMNSKNVNSNPITATVSIAQTKELTAVVEAVPSSTPLATGETIQYNYTLTNTGNVTLKTPIGVADNKATITCTDQSDIAPGASRICTGTYTVTDADMAAGSVKNTGTATAIFDNKGTPETISSAPVSKTVPTFDGPRFDITIASVLAPGNSLPTVINYTYTITNTGSAVLGPNYNITTSLPTDTIDCSLAAASLNPTESTTCTGSYTVNNTGTVTNTITDASVTGAPTANNLPQSASNLVFICNPDTVSLTHTDLGEDTITWTITNNSGSLLNLSQIHVGWPTNRRLQSVTFAPPTNTIWSGSPGDNSGSKTLTGSWAINNGSSATVRLKFNTGTNVSDFTIQFSQSACSGSIFSNP